jgi:hypothetical protein
MTALVFALQPDQVCVAMDTLVVGAQDRMPLSFQRKFLSVPESDLVVAGTGHAGFINGWFQHLQAKLVGASIDDLNAQAPELFRGSVAAARGLDGLTATIYHFGYSAQEHRYAGYAYRSESGFRGDRLPYALGFKPVVPVRPTDDMRFPEYLIDIVLQQQRHDSLRPLQEQVGVGGEIEFVHMSDRTIKIATVHRFRSYEAELTHIHRRSEA